MPTCRHSYSPKQINTQNIITMNIKLIVILSFLILPLTVSAQTSVTFSYDYSGNRITRQLYIGAKSRSRASEVTAVESLSGKKVSIHPILAESKVRVEILGLTDADICILRVYNLSGKLLKEQNAENSTILDLSSYKKDCYILSVELNKEKKTWKIIKD